MFCRTFFAIQPQRSLQHRPVASGPVVASIQHPVILRYFKYLSAQTRKTTIFVGYPSLLLLVIWVWVNTYRYIFSGMNIHKSQLFWGSLGTRVLTHPHIQFWPVTAQISIPIEALGH